MGFTGAWRQDVRALTKGRVKRSTELSVYAKRGEAPQMSRKSIFAIEKGNEADKDERARYSASAFYAGTLSSRELKKVAEMI